MRRLHPPIVTALLPLALLCAASGCAPSPTAPGPADVTGVWTGSLPVRMPDEDWSLVTMALHQNERDVTGRLSTRSGTEYPVTGTVGHNGGTLSVGGLPGTSLCAAIELVISSVKTDKRRAQRLLGHASGRCYGTVSGGFQLQRAREQLTRSHSWEWVRNAGVLEPGGGARTGMTSQR